MPRDRRQIARLGRHLSTFLQQNCNRIPDLVFAVSRRQEEPEPGGPFRHRRIKDRLHIDATTEQRLCKSPGADRAPGHDGNNGGADGSTDVETPFPREP